MKDNIHQRRRLKATGIALAGLIAGILLLFLSRWILPEKTNAAATQPATATQAAEPTSQPATAPADSSPAGRKPAPDPQAAAARNMSGMLVLFSMMGFMVAIIAMGWIVYDVRASRPAWMRQKKYPVRRK